MTVNADSKRVRVDNVPRSHPGLTGDERRPDFRNAEAFGKAEAAEIVHDFRNTVAVIAMLCEFMLKELPEKSAAWEAGRDMRLACNDAQALCEQMLAESRGTLDCGQRIDLSNLVTGMAAMLSTCVPPASRLRFDLAVELPSMEIDRVAMRQLLIKLVKNAAEALDDRPGTVTVSTGWIELDDADVRDGKGCREPRSGQSMYLAVSDTGCGMDEETRARLLGRIRTTRTNGHGLGLASVRRIAAAHGADLQIESRVGEGTTVRVVFDKAGFRLPREFGKENRPR